MITNRACSHGVLHFCTRVQAILGHSMYFKPSANTVIPQKITSKIMFAAEKVLKIIILGVIYSDVCFDLSRTFDTSI